MSNELDESSGQQHPEPGVASAESTGEVKSPLGEGSVGRELVKAALSEGSSYSEAAALGGVSKRTVVRWMAEASFSREVADLRVEYLSQVTGQLGGLAVTAVSVLRDALASERAVERLRAAQLTLEWAARLRRDVDVEGRLLELEGRQGLRRRDADGSVGDAGEVRS